MNFNKCTHLSRYRIFFSPVPQILSQHGQFPAPRLSFQTGLIRLPTLWFCLFQNIIHWNHTVCSLLSLAYSIFYNAFVIFLHYCLYQQVVHSFLLLSSIPLYRYIIVCLSILLWTLQLSFGGGYIMSALRRRKLRLKEVKSECHSAKKGLGHMYTHG